MTARGIPPAPPASLKKKKKFQGKKFQKKKKNEFQKKKNSKKKIQKKNWGGGGAWGGVRGRVQGGGHGAGLRGGGAWYGAGRGGMGGYGAGGGNGTTLWEGFAMHCGIGTPPHPAPPPPRVNRQTENITFARFAKRAVINCVVIGFCVVSFPVTLHDYKVSVIAMDLHVDTFHDLEQLCDKQRVLLYIYQNIVWYIIFVTFSH